MFSTGTPFVRKMIFGWLLCQLIVVFVVVPIGLYVVKITEVEHLQERATAAKRLILAATLDPMVAGDTETLEAASKEIVKGREVVALQFVDDKGNILAAASDHAEQVGDIHETDLDEFSLLNVFDDNATFNRRIAVEISTVRVGEIRVSYSLAHIKTKLAFLLVLIASVSVGMLALAVPLSIMLGRYLQSELTMLENGAREIATGDIGKQIKGPEHAILASTIDAFNLMSRRLKQTYERAIESEQNLRDAIETLPDAFCVYDPDDKLLLCNKRYANLLATAGLDAIAGMKFEELVRSGLEAGVFDVAEDDREEWLNTYLEEHRRGSVSREIRMTSGRWIRVEEHKTERGNVIGFRIDITALKEREQAFALSEGRLRTTVEAALDCIICIDRDGCIREFNSAAEKTFGYRREDVMGRQMAPLIIPPSYRDMHERGMKKYLETGEGPLLGKRIEVVAMHCDGTEFPCELSLEATGSGDDILFVSFMRDITEQRKQAEALHTARERAEDASRAKDGFLAMMTHEIRTPLNGVLGILGLLQDTRLNPEQQDYVRSARASGDILMQILNDILDYSKMDAGKLELETAPLRLKSVIEPVSQILVPRVEGKDLDFRVSISPDIPDCIVGDLGRIRQVLLNLAYNAVKFTESGFVSVSVSKVDAIFDEPQPAIKFEVQDTGVGISEEDQGRLFVEFNQLDASHARKYGGTGLGLAICRDLVDLMGGAIGCTSEVGKGSCFYFTIPLIEGNPADLEEDETPSVIEHDVRSCRILLAEDNATNSMIVKLMLEKAGHRVDTAMDGEEALQAVKSLPYDVVLMDVNMPEMDGFTATRHIRSLPKPNCSVPIIALTALAMEGDKQSVLDAGMDGYMTKPISRLQLLKTVQNYAVGNGDPEATDDQSGEVSDQDDVLVDQAVIQKLGEDTDPEIVPELLKLYVEDTKRRVEDLKAALDAGDLDKIEHETHTMASSAAMHGASRLFRISRQTEECCREPNSKHPAELAREVIETAEATFDALENVAMTFKE